MVAGGRHSAARPAPGATRLATLGPVRIRRVARLVAGLAFVAATLVVVTGSAVGAGTVISTISLHQAVAYKPHAPPGATDDYHCTLMNPHVKTNSYIISSQFFPGSPEDHHAILFLVPPDLAASAEAANVNNLGWSCFGETPIPNTGLGQISNTPWLSAWAPGHGADHLPKDTGIYLPAGQPGGHAGPLQPARRATSRSRTRCSCTPCRH